MYKIYLTALVLAASLAANLVHADASNGLSALIQPTTGTGSGSGTGTTGTGTTSSSLVALNDLITVIPGKTSSVTGNVTANDSGGGSTALSASLISSPVSIYGFLSFDSTGAYTYNVYANSPSITKLKAGQIVTDQFTYKISSGTLSATAKLIVTIISNPVDGNGNTVFQVQTDNVEVEFNNTSATATPLTSGLRMDGALYDSGDRDFYTITSNGGNEIIHIGVCEQGSVCAGKKSWVMYVFDADKLTAAMENAAPKLRTFDDVSGAIVALTPNKQMYLAYQLGVYEGALIDVVDPNFDTTNSIDVGTPAGPKKYFIAISVPLKINANGSVIGTQPGDPYSVGGVKDTTTQETVLAYPNSDDQYALTVTRTGINPLAVPATTSNAPMSNATALASFDEKNHIITVPKLRIFNDLYAASFSYRGSLLKKSVDLSQNVTLSLKKVNGLAATLTGDSYIATYNPSNDQVVLSTIRDVKTGILYTVVLQFHPPFGNKALWLEVLSVTPQ